MEQIEELERRLAAALERIANGVSVMSDAGTDDTGPLQAELEDERLANQQLKERVRKLSDQVESVRQTTADQIANLDVELQRLRQSNEQLRAANAALREANAAGVGDAHLINKSMLSELEGLRAARAAEAAEAATIMGALETLLEGQEDNQHA